MASQVQTKLIQYLQEDLAIPADFLGIALRNSQQDLTQLPMVLWQYGLVSLGQLEQIFDWLEAV